MTITILGQHIRLIRPEKIKMPVILKKDLPRPRYNTKPSRLIKVNIDWIRNSITIPSKPTYYSK